MAAPVITYCAKSDIENFLSVAGLLTRADDAKSGLVDPAVLGAAVNMGTLEVNKYIQRRYDPAQLQNSELVKYFSTCFACAYLCRRKGNGVPESLAEELDIIIGQLEDIRDGKLDVPDMNERTARGPSVINYRADARFARPLRRQENQSTPRLSKSTTGTDYADQVATPQ